MDTAPLEAAPSLSSWKKSLSIFDKPLATSPTPREASAAPAAAASSRLTSESSLLFCTAAAADGSAPPSVAEREGLVEDNRREDNSEVALTRDVRLAKSKDDSFNPKEQRD